MVPGSVLRRGSVAPARLSRWEVPPGEALFRGGEISFHGAHRHGSRGARGSGRGGDTFALHPHARARRKNRRERNLPAAALAQAGKVTALPRDGTVPIPADAFTAKGSEVDP